MSDRTTGATYAQIEDAAREVWVQLQNLTDAGYTDWTRISETIKNHMRGRAKLILGRACPPGMVIAPAADVLTSDQRAAIGRYVVFMDGDNTPYEDDIDLWESDKSIFRAIADGGAV